MVIIHMVIDIIIPWIKNFKMDVIFFFYLYYANKMDNQEIDLFQSQSGAFYFISRFDHL